jgi:hypothetical protein
VEGDPMNPPLSVRVTVTVHTARLPNTSNSSVCIRRSGKAEKIFSKRLLDGHAADVTPSDLTLDHAVIRIENGKRGGINSGIAVL